MIISDYLDYLWDAAYLVNYFVFNQRLDLIRSVGTSSPFQRNISTSEPSESRTNSVVSYGTISVNGTYLFVIRTNLSFLSGNKWPFRKEKKCLSIRSLYIFNLKPIHNPIMNRRARRVEMSSYVYIYIHQEKYWRFRIFVNINLPDTPA